ncbi:HERC1, partial [Symbiodinium sp. CCMP2592]
MVDFPARPPKFKFESKWINHQHLWGDRICHSLLSDDFLDFFRERRTHSTSLWNASCALSDEEGLGGMPRYLQILREFLGCDSDYDEEQHVKYDASSLEADVAAQRSFKPEWWEESSRLEPEASATTQPEAEAAQSKEEVWGIDFFSKEPTHVGDADRHPCFDVAENPGRVPSLSTSMACLSPQSFEMGAKTTDFGTPIKVILPYPVSTEAWSSVGRSLAASGLAALAPLAEGMYQLKLNSCRSGDSATRFEGILNIIGEVWKTTCIGIVKDSNYESERAVMCFVTLHFLLLCLAQDHPQLREHTAATVREFLERIDAAPSENLKTAVPDLGRFLVRFLLTESELSLRDHLAPIVRELFRRNVRWVHPDHWADGDASEDEKEEQVDAAFEASQFGM